MKKSIQKINYYWLTAGIVNLLTALIHTFGGQMDLVNPLLKSNLSDQTKAEWFGVWHLVTLLLFATSYVIFRNTLVAVQVRKPEIISSIGFLYVLFSVPFIISSIINSLLAPQWILLLPIGLLLLFGIKREKL
jgi:hypothetical protein